VAQEEEEEEEEGQEGRAEDYEVSFVFDRVSGCQRPMPPSAYISIINSGQAQALESPICILHRMGEGGREDVAHSF
jgi:hypothetical protein